MGLPRGLFRQVAVRGALLAALMGAAHSAAADAFAECGYGSVSNEARVDACTEVLQTTGIGDETRSAALTNRGSAHSFLGNFSLAERDFSQSIEVSPGNDAAYFNRGQLYFDVKKYEAALADYHAALLLDSKIVLAKRRLAEAYCMLGREELSLRAWSNFMAVDRKAIVIVQTELHDQGLFSALISGEVDKWTVEALSGWVNQGCPAESE